MIKNNSTNNSPDKDKGSKVNFKSKLPFLLFLLVISLLLYKPFSQNIPEISYSDFREILNTNPEIIQKAEIEENGNKLILHFQGDEQKRVRLTKSFTGNSYLLKDLEEKNVQTKVIPAQSDRVIFFLINFLPVLLLLFFIVLLFRGSMGGGGGGFGFMKSKAKLFEEDNVKVTFKDVAGIDEAQQELEEIVEFLKSPEKFRSLGAKIPRGILLVGAPGTGKTLLAKAIAGEASVPFYSISGSDFSEVFVGVGASRVRDLFEQARKSSPCIVFIDEIDSVGKQRSPKAGFGGSDDQTLNQLLVEMDGFDGSNSNVIVLAATNRSDILDKALTRPGRFDRQVSLDLPDAKGREQILTVHAKGKTLSEEVDLKVLAKRTPGFTGAQLANIMNESALIAASRDKKAIDNKDLDAAVDKVWMGSERSLTMPFKELEATAYHETGHALMALLDDQMPLHKVTIIPRSRALGITWSLTKDDYTHWTRKSLMNRIKVSYGGMVAEELVYDNTTAGVVADLQQATQIARSMVMEYGMSELGPIAFKSDSDIFTSDRNYSEDMAKAIDDEVQRLLKSTYQEVKEYLSNKRAEMDAIVLELLKRETLEEKEVRSIIEQVESGEFNFDSVRAEVEEIKIKFNKEREDEQTDREA